MSNNNPTDQRAQVIAGLRALADFLEANPDVPVSPVTGAYASYYPRGTEEEERAEVDRIAALLGVTAKGEEQYTAERRFGPVCYSATAITREHTSRYRALMSYSDAVQPNEPAGAVA